MRAAAAGIQANDAAERIARWLTGEEIALPAEGAAGGAGERRPTA